ncbi:hypothetical protein Hanom_Chr00s004978g01727151 [Helianthus anomalus]
MNLLTIFSSCLLIFHKTASNASFWRVALNDVACALMKDALGWGALNGSCTS